jgi:hypothetical protein
VQKLTVDVELLLLVQLLAHAPWNVPPAVMHPLLDSLMGVPVVVQLLSHPVVADTKNDQKSRWCDALTSPLEASITPATSI